MAPTTPSAPAPRARKVSRHRGEGQWAAGHLTPLNANEQIKKDDDGLNVRTADRDDLLPQPGFDSIDPRRPARPDALVGPVHPAQARHRRRQDRDPGAGGAGRQVLHAARPHRRRPADHRRSCGSIGEISHRVRPRHRRPHRPAERPAALDPDRGRPGRSGSGWRRSGCPPPRPAATRPRVILGSPVAGIAADEIIDGTPADRRDPRALHRQQGVLQPAAQVQDRDLRLARGWTSRTRSTTSRSSASCTPSTARASTCGSAAGCPPTRSSAQRLGAWVPLDEVPDVWAGRHRRSSATTATAGCAHRARLKFLVADWGAGEVPRGAGGRVPQAHADRRPGARAAAPAPRDHVGVHRQKDGRFYVGFAPTVGRVAGDDCCTKIADLAEAHGSEPGPHHRRAEDGHPRRRARTRSTSLVAALEALGPAGQARRPFRRSTMACTGIEFCKLAIVETKAARRMR